MAVQCRPPLWRALLLDSPCLRGCWQESCCFGVQRQVCGLSDSPPATYTPHNGQLAPTISPTLSSRRLGCACWAMASSAGLRGWYQLGEWTRLEIRTNYKRLDPAAANQGSAICWHFNAWALLSSTAGSSVAGSRGPVCFQPMGGGPQQISTFHWMH